MEKYKKILNLISLRMIHCNSKTEEEKDKVQDEIIGYINQDEKILTAVDEDGNNVGLLAAIFNLEKVVLRTLDSNEASLQQNRYGENIGMLSAMCGFKQATLKALENKEASLQQDAAGKNIGMYAAEICMKEAVLKALENKEASLQEDRDKMTIATLYEVGKLEEINDLKLYKIEEYIKKYQQKVDYNKSILEYELLALIDKNEAVLYLLNDRGENLGMICVEKGLDMVALRALKNRQASLKRDITGKNIGMIAAMKHNQRVAMRALENKEASLQQDKWGRNIGMFAAMHELDKTTLKALENKEASIQQDAKGKNIGMYAAEKLMKLATQKALENEEASLQKDEQDKTIEKTYEDALIKYNQTKKEQEVLHDEYNEILNKL